MFVYVFLYSFTFYFFTSCCMSGIRLKEATVCASLSGSVRLCLSVSVSVCLSRSLSVSAEPQVGICGWLSKLWSLLRSLL